MKLGGFDDDWCDDPIVYPQPPEATETENPVIGELLGPRGETIRQWRERPTVAFGFQRPRGIR